MDDDKEEAPGASVSDTQPQTAARAEAPGEWEEHAPIRVAYLPWWLKEEIANPRIPEGLKVAYETILGPLFADLVVGAPDALRRAAGELLCSLTWIELRRQQELSEMVAHMAQSDDENMRVAMDDAIGRFLRLAREKMKALDVVERLRRDGTAGWLRYDLFDPLHNIAIAAAERNIFDGGRIEIRDPKTASGSGPA